MAQPPQRPAPPTKPAPSEPPRHPAQGAPAQPGVAQPDQQPKPPDDPNAKPAPEEKVIDKAEAAALFRAGHRLKKKGDPPEKWFSASRLHNTLVICYPVDEEVEKTVLEQELVLADEPPQP